jgi:hypothetical protein
MERTHSELIAAEYKTHACDAFIKSMIAEFPRLINPKTPEEDFIEFETIWNKYFTIITTDWYDFDYYCIIVQKIREGDFNFVQYKDTFIELTDIIADTIYHYKKLDKVFNEKFNNKKEYSDTELNCCYHVKKNLIRLKIE